MTFELGAGAAVLTLIFPVLWVLMLLDTSDWYIAHRRRVLERRRARGGTYRFRLGKAIGRRLSGRRP